MIVRDIDYLCLHTTNSKIANRWKDRSTFALGSIPGTSRLSDPLETHLTLVLWPFSINDYSVTWVPHSRYLKTDVPAINIDRLKLSLISVRPPHRAHHLGAEPKAPAIPGLDWTVLKEVADTEPTSLIISTYHLSYSTVTIPKPPQNPQNLSGFDLGLSTMSTPTTATATHPSHHGHYGYAHHHHQSTYQSNNAGYPATSSAGPSRLANSYAYSASTPTSTLAGPTATSKPLIAVPPATTATTATTTTTKMSSSTAQQNSPAVDQNSHVVIASRTSTRRKKKPDWGEFYKNGIPQEVIVIDDTPPPDQRNAHSLSHPSSIQAGPVATSSITNQPAGKKRRTGVDTAYDLGYYDRPSYSINPQQYGDNSPAGSISTERTTSMNTTAPTSLGSHASIGTNGVLYEDATVGQKRKRVSTRKSVRDEQKRKEQETATDAFLSYIPPPNPPIKAKDVPVPVIRDVSICFSPSSLILPSRFCDGYRSSHFVFTKDPLPLYL